MNTIHFYEKNRNLVMSFSEFTTQNNSVDDIIYFQIKINYAFFNVNTKIECEKIAFENLSKNLQNIYEGKSHSATFNHMERQLTMKFDLLEHGQIKVTIEFSQYIFYDNICKAVLQFEYMIDQSFLLELIEEINTVTNS